MNTPVRRIVDLKETVNGDLVIVAGDLSDTGSDYPLATEQLFRTILNTKVGESLLFPYMGFNADTYEGKNNTEKLGYQIARAVKETLVDHSPFYANEITTDAYPLTKNSIAIRIVVHTVGERLTMTMVYDTSTNMIKSMVV